MSPRRLARSWLLACIGAIHSGCVYAPFDELSDSDELSDDEGTDTGPCEPFETTEIAECLSIVGEGFCSEGGIHVEQGSEIPWSNNPPHSGDHYSLTSPEGEQTNPIPRGNWVHNLEHGWIVLVYNCPAGCETELDVLREVLAARPDHTMVLTEDPLLDGPRFAAIAWTWVLEFDDPVLAELLCFVDQHYDHSPETVH